MKDRVLGELRGVFRPEFLNRIDDIIVFHALDRRHMQQIVGLLLKRVSNRLEEHDTYTYCHRQRSRVPRTCRL